MAKITQQPSLLLDERVKENKDNIGLLQEQIDNIEVPTLSILDTLDPLPDDWRERAPLAGVVYDYLVILGLEGTDIAKEYVDAKDAILQANISANTTLIAGKADTTYVNEELGKKFTSSTTLDNGTTLQLYTTKTTGHASIGFKNTGTDINGTDINTYFELRINDDGITEIKMGGIDEINGLPIAKGTKD